MHMLKTPSSRVAETFDPEVARATATILEQVEREGQSAVRRHSQLLDGWDPPSFVLSASERSRAIDQVPADLGEHIDAACERISEFARQQRSTLLDLWIEPMDGVVLGHRHIPVESVGAYAPGGRYPLISSVLMCVAVAKAAGVDRVIACAPSRPGGAGMHPAQVYAMEAAGADEIVCLGGVQALAAMAFGSLPGVAAVDMIVGPGNAYVAEAKRQLFGRVGIDLLAGPTELLIIADEHSDPRLVAADLLAQAEHGPTSPVGLLTTSSELGEEVIAAVDVWLEDWPTAEVAGRAWSDCGWVEVCADREEAASRSDEMAYEHVHIHARDLDWYLTRLRQYGSLFLGPHATVAFSDKALGPNHTLPTRRAARSTGGLWVGKFLKTVTFQQLTAEGAAAIAPSAAAICDAESMAGHALSSRLRESASAGD